MPFRTQRRRGGFALVALLTAAWSVAFASPLQAQSVSDPRVAEFDPSPDHWTALESGQPAVLRYELEMYILGAASPLLTVDMGKPSPAQDGKIRYDFTSAVTGMTWPAGQLEARVNAVGPEGSAASDASNPFSFSTGAGCAAALSTSTIQAPAAGGSYTIGVSINSGCRWAASTSQAWLILSTTSGTGIGTVPVQVRASSSTSSRTGIVYIGGQTLTVWQAAGANGSASNTPTLSWPTPLAITQGTPLGALQLNATANVAGRFTYTPPAGTVLPAGSHTLTATFVPSDLSFYRTATTYTTIVVDSARFRLTVSRPTGGTIAAAGIKCGTSDYVCQVTMPGSMRLGLEATADSAFVFTGWTGACTGTSPSVLLTLDGVKTCGAVFTAAAPVAPAGPTTSSGAGTAPAGPRYALTVSRPTGGTVMGAGIKCGTAGGFCWVGMPGSMTLGLEAVPDAGYAFAGWTGACAGTSPSVLLALDGVKTCGAAFTPARGTDQ
jgi:hypothetical protein